jgi:uncharacterized protein YggE
MKIKFAPLVQIKNALLILLVAAAAFLNAGAQTISAGSMPTISVTGTAEIQVVPDTATLSFTVSKKNNVVATAKKQNDETIAKVTELAKRFGVAAADVKTDYISVKEATRREKIKDSDDDYAQVFDGYIVSRNLVVKLRDISKFESFLTALLDADVSDVNGVVFGSSELRKYKDQARAQAVRAAREKAQALAREINQSIGKAVSIEEENADGYNSPSQNYSSNSVSFSGDKSDLAAVGTISVKAQVAVKFLLN